MNLFSYLRRHAKNDKTPYVMEGMAGFFAILILGLFGLSAVDHYLLRSGSLASVVSAVLVELTNDDRGASELGGLTISPVLAAAAQAKADDMAMKGYFAHISPDGKDSWYWFKQEGYAFTYAGENLAVDFSDSIDVERAWMNSPTHRDNILNGNFKEIGIATAQGTYKGRPTTFVVQMFGTPSISEASLAVRTATLPEEPTAPAFAAAEPEPASNVAGSAAAPEATGIEAGAGVSVNPNTEKVSGEASWWQHLLASPKSMLQYAYYVLAGVILILIAFVTEFEFHRRHLRHVASAALLFVLMVGVFVFANFILFAQPIIAALAP